MQTPAGEAPGPWLLGTIGVGKGEDGKTPKTTALKGLAIKVGEKGEAAVAYDLDLCRLSGAWTGKFTTPMNLMSRGEYPVAMGDVAFTTGEVAGFIALDGPHSKDAKDAKSDEAKTPLRPSQPLREASPGGDWKDPRPKPFGPLPQGQARFKGFYVNGDKTILKWDIGGTEVLEMPGYDGSQSPGLFTRTFRIAPATRPLSIAIAPVHPKLETELRENGASLDKIMLNKTWFAEAVTKGQIADRDLPFIDFAGSCIVPRVDTDGSVKPTWHLRNNHLWVEVPPHDQPLQMRFTLYGGREDVGGQAIGRMSTEKVPPIIDVTQLTNGGPARWPEPVVTKGEVSTDTTTAYVVDTIKLPDPNPWNAPMFLGGLDFFPDGRAAVCTFHGDLFVVSGIDAKLEKVVWKRFASGLYHALGLKIVKGEIYVTCRDGIWRLNDLNKDGECDFYEAFNHDVMVTKNFHEFVFDLQTDPAGNFYFAKAGPVKNGGRGFDEICAHHGSLLRVSPDGRKLDVVATGFRAPNGIGVGPRGEMTSGDNEGTWTPACKINWIKPGGFYGVVPLAHRDPPPTDYDRPLCWLPKRVDNSGGGQVWVTSDKWGPWKDQLLHLSYGTCSLFGVMREEVGGTTQGGVTRFPVSFQSGTMRARFNPADGQLYIAGLRGWQTTGVKNGALQRVRYTGAPVRMPVGLQATKRGVRIDFTCALDAASASDPQSWNIEVWNYLWSSAYGSPELSTLGTADQPVEAGKDGVGQFTNAQLGQKKHDPLTVKSATLSADKKSVFLEIPDLKPVMQMQLKFTLKSADGADLRSEVINTIHALGE